MGEVFNTPPPIWLPKIFFIYLDVIKKTNGYEKGKIGSDGRVDR